MKSLRNRLGGLLAPPLVARGARNYNKIREYNRQKTLQIKGCKHQVVLHIFNVVHTVFTAITSDTTFDMLSLSDQAFEKHYQI